MPLARSRSCLFLALIALTATVAAAEPEKKDDAKPERRHEDVSALPQIPEGIHDALQSREFEDAADLIDEFLEKSAKDARAPYLLYLKGRAQTELGQYDEALATFSQTEKEHGESRWVSRARFGRADVYARRRNYQEAGTIYRAEAERLLSDDRKDELTGIYLEFADRYFEGVPQEKPGAPKQPDYNQALTYYREALKLNPSRALRQKIELRVARSLQELGQLPEAIAAYQAFLKSYSGKEVADEKHAPAAMVAEARFRLGMAQLGAGQPAEARKTWQDFLASADAKEAGDLVAQATYHLARTYGMPTPGSAGDLELGVAALEAFVRKFPKHELAPKAEYEVAQAYVHFGRYEQAIARLKALIANEEYAKSDVLPEARRLLGQSYFAQKKFEEAIAAWKEFLEAHPNSSSWSDVQRLVIDAEYQRAETQYAEKNYEQARELWGTFLNKYPLDPRAAQVLFRFGQMKYAQGVECAREERQAAKGDGKKGAADAEADDEDSRAVSDKCRAFFEEAIGDWERLVSKYPGTNEASQAAYMIGVALEDQLGRLADALEAYKKVAGSYQGQAQQRIANLTAKQLEVVTERKYRSNETPRIRVETRNVEKVTVKAYRVDMTDYFRKMHLARGVETLDIALIDPDKTIDHSVEGYEEYRRLVNHVEIPLDEPGVMAVTVSSDTLEATTMVVVSDIDVIVKASRNELFVFAENMRTQEPVEGASLLISDGETVFAEELTGEKGILQKSFDKLKSVNDLRVFAVHEGHMASTVSNLNGLDFAVGLSPRGYLYTDRPAYRPGQLVNLKGIVRWVANDQFVFKAGEKYKLDVYDSRGRVLFTRDVALSEFGTLADNFTLPETAPQGDYRIHLHQPGRDQSYDTTFVVHETKLEPIQLEIEPSRQVFYRGETVEGTITLRYYYGTPLAGRSIQYRLADDRWHTAETDAEGKVRFTFPTERFSESQPLPLVVQYPERNLSAAKTVYLATRGFDVAVSTLRDVYIAGETFDAEVKVSDPAGKPVATDLKLEVFRLLSAAEARKGASPADAEELVETQELKTDEEGEARHTLRLEKSGRYVLRATGTDRFERPVSGQKVIQISGEEDKIRLRILAEQHHYEVGETAKVQLHWREEPALALVTYEGASVLGYQLVTLKEGANALTVPLEAKLAPNFVLAVDVMRGSAYHQARSEFRVTRRLQVALKPAKTTLKPGEELQVEVTVTDAQGKPVSAELSLGLVQRNLLDVFGERQQAIHEFFEGGYRKPSVRVAASATFHYRPSTRPISDLLLAEEERRRILQQETEALRELAELARVPAAGITERAGAADDVAPVFGLPGGGTVLGLMGDGLATFDAPSLVVEGEADARSSGGRIDLFSAYNGLVQRGRYKEAEAVAELAWRQDPANPALEAMRWSAQNSQQYIVDGNAIVTGGGAGYGNFANMGGQAGGMGGFGGAVSGPMSGAGGVPLGWRKADLEWKDGAQIFDMDGERMYEDFAGRQQGQNRSGDRFEAVLGRRWSAEGVDGAQRGLQSHTMRTPRPVTRDKADNVFSFYVPVFGRAGKDLQKLNEYDESVVALNGRGEVQVVSGLPMDKLQELAKDGLTVLPGMSASETGYWNPAVLTDKDGKATVSFRLPDRSTAWKLRAKGASKETLAGQAEVEIVAREELFGELKTPLAFTTGDEATILVEVHNQSVKKDEPIDVVLRAKLGDRTTELKKEVKSAGPGIQEVEFPVEVVDGTSVELELTVSSGDLKNTSEATVPVRPFGMPVFATASGTAGQSTIAFVEFDKELPAVGRTMEIVIGPSVNRTLVDAVLGSEASVYLCGFVLPSSGVERAFSDVLGGVAVLRTMRESKTGDSPEAQAVAGRIQSSLAQLVSGQRDDGAWSWSGRPDQEADRYVSARVVWALAAARKAGFAVPQTTFDQGVAYLKTAFTQASQTDREGRAILLHGLAAAGAADFAYANQLYRERNTLSASGLLHVALALSELDRKEMSQELLALVKLPADPKTAHAATDEAAQRVIPWMQTGVELRALYLLALEDAQPGSEKAGQLADWLMAARRGSRWQPEKANGPAIAALAQWFGRTKHTDEEYTLTVFVNDKQVEKVTFDPAKDASRRLEVPAGMLAEGRQKVNFDVEGRGTFSYSVVLAGSVPADKLKGTSNDWRVTRIYEPAQRMLDGEVIPRGFHVLTGSYTAFRNPLTQLPMGERGEVSLHVWRNNVRGTQDEQLDYLVVVEPIPAGTMVLPDSVSGGYERYEVAPGSITFYIGDRPHPGEIKYTLVGYLPGGYRTAPTVVRSFYRPEQIAVTEVKPLAVLGRGKASQDEYKLTPVELFEFGKRLLAKNQNQEADEHLTQLFANWRLQDNVYQETVRMLFRTSLALEKDDRIVQYFEIIKEKYPEVEIDFESILKVADAYRELGEYERSYLVFRATVEASFQRESQIAGFLDGRGEFVRSVEVLERVLHDYPAESYVALATFALAQEVYGKAAEAGQNEKLREAKITRVDLIATSIDMLDHFLSTWPKDPAADQAAFSLLTAHLDLEQYKTAIERAEEFARWYPESELLDSYWYVIGFSQFALGNTDEALEMARKVAETTRKDPQTGVEVAAVNKWEAIYIMGQIYHSLGQPKEAIDEYEQVDDRFPDASEAIRFFTRQAIGLPEVSTVKPGEEAKVALSYRNVEGVNVKVYRIDLMKFGLMQRNLDRVTAINLAGIRPYHELTLDLGDGKDFRDREKSLDLPLEEEGAYLVVARGGSLYASGLVLITPLALEVQEDAVSGRVRATVKNVVKDAYVDDVHAKVIGSANEKFVSGETDLRGIFTADAIRGTATVIARAGESRYAFYRGKTWLGQRQEPNAAPAEPMQQQATEEGLPQLQKDGKMQLLDQIRGQNSIFNGEQRQNYRNLLDNKTQGVKAKGAY